MGEDLRQLNDRLMLTGYGGHVVLTASAKFVDAHHTADVGSPIRSVIAKFGEQLVSFDEFGIRACGCTHTRFNETKSVWRKT